MVAYEVRYNMEESEYHNGVALLDGSGPFKNAQGTAFYEARGTKEVRFKVQLSGVPELANTTIDVIVGDTKVGQMKIDAGGKGKLSVKAKPGDFPAVTDLTEVTIKTITPKQTVAEGVFGA
ncbi:MAG: hypothetical protein HY667_02315 [Chloroflexi bacterium]|nr:hypothetical protein [Chloroflexota bacterium]